MSDCSTYNAESCPKKDTVTFNQIDLNNFSIAIFGCWGVYCQDGQIQITKYKPNDDLALKNDLKVEDFFEIEDTFRGQKSVVNKLIDTFTTQGLNSLFLAGDNIYEYSQPSPLLIKELEKNINKWKLWLQNNQNISDKDQIKDQFNSIFPTKKDIKKKRKYRELYKNLDIQLQMNTGFLECFKDLKVDNIFLAYGNHDIETCNILNYQLNFQEGRYNNGTYYNVIYSDLLNVIVIDTNLYEEEGQYCDGQPIKQDDIDEQNKWFIEVINQSKCRYNIVIGHIPYKASGHKGKIIHNKGLDPIFDIIKQINQNERRVQAYFCADEHNQQLLFDEESQCYLVVVGSGGTELDEIKPIDKDEYKKYGIKKMIKDRENFGFSYIHYNSKNNNLELNMISIFNKVKFEL